jgi:pimeloyl-ACP methyl ester carboxylesterase
MKKLLHRALGMGLNLWSLVAPRAAARRCYALFATPPKPQLRPKEAAFLDTARQTRQVVDGHPVVVYHWGPETGPVVVLTYGWGYNAGRWRHFVPTLVEAGFQVVAYDPPGHGRNVTGERFLNVAINGKILHALFERHGRPEAVLAHSFGGSSAVVALERLPLAQRPKRMVLMASFSNAPQVFGAFRRALGLWPGLYYGMVRHAEAKVGASIHTFDMAQMSAQLGTVQALLVHDPQDPVTAFRHMERYHAYWPGSALLRANGAGHHLGTAEVTRAVLQFLIESKVPETAELRATPLPSEHVLLRHFAGMEVV